MATIYRTLKISAPLETVWSKISRLDGVHELMSMLASSSVDGDRRTCTTVDGATLTELVASVDTELKRLVYSIVDSPFELQFHAGSWRLYAEDKTTTRLEWFTDVKPDAATASLSPIIDAQIPGMVRALETESEGQNR